MFHLVASGYNFRERVRKEVSVPDQTEVAEITYHVLIVRINGRLLPDHITPSRNRAILRFLTSCHRNSVPSFVDVGPLVQFTLHIRFSVFLNEMTAYKVKCFGIKRRPRHPVRILFWKFQWGWAGVRAWHLHAFAPSGHIWRAGSFSIWNDRPRPHAADTYTVS